MFFVGVSLSFVQSDHRNTGTSPCDTLQARPWGLFRERPVREGLRGRYPYPGLGLWILAYCQYENAFLLNLQNLHISSGGVGDIF